MPVFELLARRRIGLGDAAQRLRHRVGAGQVRMRPLRPVARYRDIDETRIDLAQFLVAEPVLLGGAGAEVLAEDVGLRDQFFENVAAFLGLQVERDASDAAIIGLEIGARHARQDRRTARIVADFRHLDLDHLGAEIGHQHVRHRAGLRRRAGDDFYPLQRPPRAVRRLTHDVSSQNDFPPGFPGYTRKIDYRTGIIRCSYGVSFHITKGVAVFAPSPVRSYPGIDLTAGPTTMT